MPTLLCQRPPADTVDYKASKFIVCKSIGLNAGGRHFEMGDELPQGILNEHALKEIYDTPLRLIETFEFAVQDEGLMAAMIRRMPPADEEDEDDRDTDGDVKSEASVSTVANDEVDQQRPHKGKKRKP
jgi:hypothetical protein